MTCDSDKAKCITAICEHRRLGLLGRRRRERMARAAVDCVCELRAAGITDERDLQDVCRARLTREYGSIWVMIAFTIIWELVKRFLLD